MAAAARETIVRPRRNLLELQLGDVWRQRELIYFLIWRDLKVRYKQTILGAGWAVLQPLLTALVFTAVFHYMAKVPSDGAPYLLFAMAGIIPWTYFSQAVSRGSTSLVASSNLIRKVYFPRLVLPLAGVIAPLVDLLLALVVLLGLMAALGHTPPATIVALPAFVLLAAATSLTAALWLGPLHVRYRDVGHVIPFTLQLMMFASPVAYSVRLVPEKWRSLYALNPLVGVIEGMRWSLLGEVSPDWTSIAISTATVGVLLVAGLIFFKRTEESFADVI